MMKSRSTIRLRLTLFYGVSFVLCGIALLFINHRFVNEGLLKDEGHSDQRVIDTYQYTPEQVSFFYNIPTPASATHPEAHNIRDVIRGIQGDIRNEVLDDSLLGSLVALAVMFVLSIGVGWIAAGRALRPVEKLTTRARSLSETNLHERLALDGPSDELKELGDTLDAMLGRLQSAFESQRRFSASVSHELRTPLSVIRGEAELLLAEKDVSERERRFAESVRDASDRSEALLSSLLALARSESTMKNKSTIDLADLASDVVSERIEAADRQGLEVDLDVETGMVEGDHWLLERLVVNLVDNAIKHNNDGGWLRVEVDTVEDSVVLRVSNAGQQLTPVQVDEILEPFQRADRSRPGYGLGMTIVQAVVKAHEGELVVEPRDGGGLVTIVRLPIARDHARELTLAGA
jgi:signal transduction histidine kinase